MFLVLNICAIVSKVIYYQCIFDLDYFPCVFNVYSQVENAQI